jgi:TonB family protein
MNESLRIIIVALFCLQLGSWPSSAEQIEENWQPYVIYKPDPTIPAVALRNGWGGKIVCRVTINPRTGLAEEVKVIRHTGYPQLDAEMVLTFFKWRFRPGTVTHLKITYHLGILGRARILH